MPKAPHQQHPRKQHDPERHRGTPPSAAADSLAARTVLARRIAAACGSGVLLLGAAACGSGDPKNASAATSPSATSTPSGQGGPAQLPGADGKVAAVSGSTAQVQSRQNGQVAVTWTGSTTFTQQVAATLKDLDVGDCVMVTPTDTSSTGSDSSAQPTAMTATSVRITEPVNGACTPAGPGGGGPPKGAGPQTDQQGTPPSGSSSDGPPDGARVRGSFGAFGKVTAVSASGFTVAATRPGSGSTSSSTSPSTTSVTVTTDAKTTFTTTARATAADVAVGSCLRAQGTTDDTGAVTARTIALSPAVDGECGGLMVYSRDGGTGGGTGGSSTGTSTSAQES